MKSMLYTQPATTLTSVSNFVNQSNDDCRWFGIRQPRILFYITKLCVSASSLQFTRKLAYLWCNLAIFRWFSGTMMSFSFRAPKLAGPAIEPFRGGRGVGHPGRDLQIPMTQWTKGLCSCSLPKPGNCWSMEWNRTVPGHFRWVAPVAFNNPPKDRQGLFQWYISGILPANWVVIYHPSHRKKGTRNSYWLLMENDDPANHLGCRELCKYREKQPTYINNRLVGFLPSTVWYPSSETW